MLAYGKDSSALDRLRHHPVHLRHGRPAHRRRLPGALLPERQEIYIPTPSWANHAAVFKDSGLAVEKYALLQQGHHRAGL